MRPELAFLFLLLPALTGADELRTDFGGHTKLRAVAQGYPSESLFHDLAGRSAIDTSAELRLKLNLRKAGWTFNSAYQLAGLSSETLSYRGLPGDDHRLFDLTDVIDSGTDSALLHRLDRLWVGYTSEKTVVRFGRQALSWGNGLAFAPMDLVNPFDPAAIDTEYKTGDDMLYLQYLQDSGNDVQAAWVFRRDLVTGDVDEDASTMAIKYHGFLGEGEFDVLAAQTYGDTVIGFGGSRGIGGAVVSADLVVTDTVSDTYVQFVTNLMYSWIWADRNMSGVLEYYFNDFGGDLANPDLLARLLRGELYTTGRHYLAANLLVEMSPLWTVRPTLLCNIEDPGALLQLVSTYSLGDNLTLLASVNLPLGPQGTEYRGIESPLDGRYLSRDASLFAQIAWYF
jgi:hypothetical protein